LVSPRGGLPPERLGHPGALDASVLPAGDLPSDLWRSVLQAWAQAALGIIHCRGRSGLARCLDNEGEVLWEYKSKGPFYGALNPRWRASTFIVPTTQALLFLDRRSGRVHRTFNPGRGVSAPPAFRAGELYIISNWGYIYALALNHSGPG
jgi:outer membrane protein assembly factor BamB